MSSNVNNDTSAIHEIQPFDSAHVTISQAAIEDLEALAPLFEQYLIFYEMKLSPRDIRAFLGERIRKSESVIFIASKENVMTGFVQLYPLFSSVRLKKLWLLNDLFVRADYRGQKISVMLIDKAKQLAKETNAAGLMLETARSNSIANNLYQRTGFVMDIEHHYYSWT